MVHAGSWLTDLWNTYGGIWGVVFLLLLIAAGVIILIQGDREKERDKRREEIQPGYLRRKRIRGRWGWFLAIGLNIWFLTETVTRYVPGSRFGLALVIPALFYGWSVASVTGWIFWQSLYSEWKTYVWNLWRIVFAGLCVLWIFLHAIRSLLSEITPPFWWIQAAIGVAIAPILLRLSGFFELSELGASGEGDSG